MDKANVECHDSISSPLSGCAALQSGMEWPRNVPEGHELQASGVSCELDPGHFQKDTKDKLDPNANRSVKEARRSLYTLDRPGSEDKPTLNIDTLELCVDANVAWFVLFPLITPLYISTIT